MSGASTLSARDSPPVVRPHRVRLLLLVAGCLALAGALVPTAPAAATVVVHPAQSSINDTASTRRVQLIAGGLAVLGIGLIGITVWFWRSTRPDPESLAPLEMMGRRRWRRLDTIEQRHRLDAVRAHLNDEAAEAARETITPVPVVEAVPAPGPAAASPSSPEVAVPAAVVVGGVELDDEPVSVAPSAGEDASADEVAVAEGAVVEVPEVEIPVVEVTGVEVTGVEAPGDEAPGDEAPGVEAPGDEVPGDEVGADDVSGEHANVSGDPLVRAMEKDAGAG